MFGRKVIKVVIRGRTYVEKQEIHEMKNNTFINKNNHSETGYRFEFTNPVNNE